MSKVSNRDLEAIAGEIQRHVESPREALRYFELSRPRIHHTLAAIQQHCGEASRVCEIGFGPIGIGCSLLLGKSTSAFDFGDTFAALAHHLKIPHSRLNLRNKIESPQEKFDLLIFCEVLEHIDRPPAEVLAELRQWLVPGGALLLTTVNLARLSNRIRLLFGKELFARYTPENLVMGHHREYTLVELEHYLLDAGFVDVEVDYFAQADLRYSWPVRAGFLAWTRWFKSYSNVLFAWARAPDDR